MQRLLQDEMAQQGAVARKGSIQQDGYLKDYLCEVLIVKADLDRTTDSDIQASLDSQISREQELALVDTCYDPSLLAGLVSVVKSNVVCGYTHSAQVGTRGSDSGSMMFHHGFLREMEFLGDGDDVDHFIHNHGKTNRVGHVEYKAFATHRNPRMDTSAHLGMNLLLRFIVDGKPFPDFLEPKDYAHRPIFCSAKAYVRSYPPSSQYNNWKAVYNIVGIQCSKVTHQQWGQVQQRLTDAGCPLDTLERFIGYAGMGQKQMNATQKESYLYTPSVQPVCGAADGDPNHLELHKPSWDVELLPRELTTLCPWLSSELEKVTKAFDEFQHPNERKKRCLYQARGCLLAFQHWIGQAVKMLASLPLDDRNNLLVEGAPLYQRWSNHPVPCVDFFSGELLAVSATAFKMVRRKRLFY
jgi:hypothetical protein